MFGRSDGPRQPVELVTVFKSADAAAIAIAESILRSAEVDFLVLGGDPGAPWNSPAGIPTFGRRIEIQVRREDEADAREMLADLVREPTSDYSGPWDEE